MEQEALARLLKLSQRELGPGITMQNILDFTKALKVIAVSKGTVSLPKQYDDIWHLSLLDTEYYPYICKFINEKFVQHNPIGGKKLADRRKQFDEKFLKSNQRKINPVKTRLRKVKTRRITRRSCGVKTVRRC